MNSRWFFNTMLSNKMKNTNIYKRLSILGILSVFLTAAALLIGCSDDVKPREGAIEGRILNLTGKGLKDALVEWEYDRTKWGLTDENGHYLVDGVGFGTQNFVITANGYRSTIFKAPVYSGLTTHVNDVSIQGLSFVYSDIKVEKTTATTALISWKTSDYTNAVIEYGLTEALGKYAREKAGFYSTTHSLEITNLDPEKTYYFKISASREGQSIESSIISTFSTLNSFEDGSAPTPPTNVEAALNGIPGQVVVFWKPNYEADLKGYKIYRSDVSTGNFTEVTNGFMARGQERFTDTTVIPGKKYFYHVTAVDQANNESGFNNVTEILVPGNITSEVHWTLANSPYIVKGDINVSEFGILHIDGGVKVLIDETDGLNSGVNDLIEINVNGTLIASAGNSLPITIAANKPNPSKATWNGIKFTNSSNVSNTMVNFVISDADKGISIDNSDLILSKVEMINCNTAVEIMNTSDVTVDKIITRRCTTGINISNNKNATVTNCTFIHPTNCIIATNNNGLRVTGSNMLEYTGTGIISDEAGGIVEFLNNLFVSPSSLALQINGKCQRVENSVFDSPYAIQIKSEIPAIQKNLFMAERSLYSEGKKCIEYLGINSEPEFGPNNVEGFSAENAYINCSAHTESTTSSDIMLVKDVSGEKYDYRLRQPYPNNSDPWGIIREENPYFEE